MHNTFFGDFWHFGTDNELGMATFDDTAYGSEEIGPHSDGTYFDQPPGIQVYIFLIFKGFLVKGCLFTGPCGKMEKGFFSIFFEVCQ